MMKIFNREMVTGAEVGDCRVNALQFQKPPKNLPRDITDIPQGEAHLHKALGHCCKPHGKT